jgi:hypothetical protein
MKGNVVVERFNTTLGELLSRKITEKSEKFKTEKQFVKVLKDSKTSGHQLTGILRSVNQNLLTINRARTTFAESSFRHSAPVSGNSGHYPVAIVYIKASPFKSLT